MDSAALINDFSSYLEKNRRMSAHTVLAYTADLGYFQAFLRECGETDLKKVDSFHVRDWMASLVEEGLTVKTVHRKLSTLRAFYRYLIQQEILEVNPLAKLSAPKLPKKIVQDIPAPDLLNLFRNYPWSEEAQGERDRLILLCFYTTGMRLSELLGLKCRDIDLGRMNMSVLGKRNKQRIIPIHPELADALQDQLGSREYLFELKPGKPLYPMYVNRLVNRYLKLFSTAAKTSPHVLRHSFATHLLNNGAELMAIKEILGHSSLAATQVYTKNSWEKLKLVHGLHPRER